MKSYLIKRFFGSLISLTIVISIIFSLVYTAVPKDRVFYTDTNIEKLQKRPDDLLKYKHLQWERLGYIEFATIADFCRQQKGTGEGCDSKTVINGQNFEDYHLQKGFEVKNFPISQVPFAFREIPNLERILNFWARLIRIDHPFRVEGPAKVYVGRDFSGNPSVMCSGCEHKYLVYFNGRFPFIHQNILSFDLGMSYPTYSGREVLEVLTASQGRKLIKEVTLPSGEVIETAIDPHSCRRSPSTHEEGIFQDGFSQCDFFREDPSMLMISFRIGLGALLVSYGIGLPLGVMMARFQGRAVDRLGQGYIILMMSVPSLAFVVLIRYIGGRFGGLPTLFAMYGANHVRSYILPVLSLSIASVAGRMMWMRRYMVDQGGHDYVRFARSKGLSERQLFGRHIFRNAIGPIAHGIPAAVIFTLTGAMITESVYGIPGMGKLLPDSISANNHSMVIGITFLFTMLSVLATLLGDMLLSFLDPRISLEDQKNICKNNQRKKLGRGRNG